MSLSYPLLLILGLVVASALIAGAVLAGRRRSAALAAAGVSVAGRRNNQLGLWLSMGGVVLLAVAVAGPAAALPVARSAGTVVLAMDVSRVRGPRHGQVRIAPRRRRRCRGCGLPVGPRWRRRFSVR